MKTVSYQWSSGESSHVLELAYVSGTSGEPYSFGEGAASRPMEVSDFWMATTPTTQAFWTHVMGDGRNPAIAQGPRRPQENVSWDGLHRSGGFLDRINSSDIRDQLTTQISLPRAVFRLPSEAEWEYAARGGPHWRDGFRYSGSNEIDGIAWYARKDGDHTQDVARKAPNQLGLFDMCGNVWEWCEDAYTPEVNDLPPDGRPYGVAGREFERSLRGGCFHNWAMHCTVAKRYQIGGQFHDGCIGFRLVLSR